MTTSSSEQSTDSIFESLSQTDEDADSYMEPGPVEADDTDSYMEPGPVEPLLRSTSRFLTKAAQSLGREESSAPKFLAAAPFCEKFRLWAFSFNTNDCSLDQILDEIPSTREAVIGLVCNFVAIIVGGFSDCKTPNVILAIADRWDI